MTQVQVRHVDRRALSSADRGPVAQGRYGRRQSRERTAVVELLSGEPQSLSLGVGVEGALDCADDRRRAAEQGCDLARAQRARQRAARCLYLNRKQD